MNSTAHMAMKASNSVMHRQTVALPGDEGVVAIVLAKAGDELRRLSNLVQIDEGWDEVDVDVDMAMELARDQIERMKGRQYEEGFDFFRDWYRAGAVVNLAAATFSRKDCHYYRALQCASNMFTQLAQLVEFVEMKERGMTTH